MSAAADLVPEGTYDLVTFTGDLSGASAGGSRFLECVFDGAILHDVRMPRARLSDCQFSGVRGAGTDWSETEWLDCVVEQARLGAPQLHGATLRRVRFEGGKVEFLNLRGASLREVTFVDCVLVEPDFADATLREVSFVGCRLVEPQFDKVKCRDVDLSRAELVAPRGLASLKGATLSRGQVIEAAEALAVQLGIRMRD